MKIIIAAAIAIVITGAVGSAGTVAWGRAAAAYDARSTNVRIAALVSGNMG
ncbi:hypothetical protein AA12717_3732 [Gluconacetobacter sacchari DSM 12717]|uniref:Uncharacterized protein n=2 Tax=Gluconacetobacter sacchari TaxID=92759 RepID=A0A7W4NP98_9PROT|nr:hypothetical protein [Gluconacetobacter sacchari]MBB2158968.1 hypothetical protein [Gluconacetobacter sacchari]GBQ31340.1 hypothetical protein AA12717_3732 [Gluconacetobacter sacchari DSM 12717]